MRFYQYFLIILSIPFWTNCNHKKDIESGVSLELAVQRKSFVNDVSYELSFDIPESIDKKVSIEAQINFKLSAVDQDLILDFSAPVGSVRAIHVNEREVDINHQNGHLVIKAELLKKGLNKIFVQGFSDNLSLNRNEDFLYTLFVPDRASSAFPCFDQPDLKAKYLLNISVPLKWEVLTSVKEESVEEKENRKVVSFGWSEPMSTYLFSFVTGNFKRVKSTVGGREMEMLYRESNGSLVQRNLSEIFTLHRRSIEWLEQYTGILYPFSKFDFALIPGFQYGGMEHVGAIQYRAELLFLDESASIKQQIRRVSLIAHESAHMWFGNLVTMEWFDDVWMKEVFANFMADKIVKEMFPDINHDLNFLFAHYPKAYDVDRTKGANAIRQPLDNLNNAGNMYGDIIYHKAPIAMKQLEMLIGENELRLGLRDYLENYSFDNASWDDLISVLERVSSGELKEWSNAWIKSPGRPYLNLILEEKSEENEYVIQQIDPFGAGNIWPQKWSVFWDYESGGVHQVITIKDSSSIIRQENSVERVRFIDLNSNGAGYGVFSQGLSYVKNEFIFDRLRVDISMIENDSKRGTSYLNLHEFLLEEGFHPQLYYSFLEIYLETEKNELVLSYLLDIIKEVYFRFFDDNLRKQHASNFETTLWNKLSSSESLSTKSLILDTYIDIAQTENAVMRLKDLWEGTREIEGLQLTKKQKEDIALSIAFKDENGGMEYFRKQLNLTIDVDKKSKLEFIKPVFSSHQEDLDAFFETLKVPKNREHETWVLSALHYLHHPLRNEKSLSLVRPSLDLLEEIRITGDIFFPKRWMENVLGGYNSQQAANIINDFLIEKPDLNKHLKMKLLQSSDMVFRGNENLKYYHSIK
ncbi:MAG: hypothetical protein JXR07_13735 [Reichenbachiella sp.]